MGPYDYLMFIFPFGVRLILICFIQISLLTTDTFVFFGGLRVVAERRTGRIFLIFNFHKISTRSSEQTSYGF